MLALSPCSQYKNTKGFITFIYQRLINYFSVQNSTKLVYRLYKTTRTLHPLYFIDSRV